MSDGQYVYTIMNVSTGTIVHEIIPISTSLSLYPLFLNGVAFTGAYTDLSGKPVLSTVATSGAYVDLSGKPSLATVATSGAYADLSGKPTIPSAQVNSDWNAVSGVAQILNKPTNFVSPSFTIPTFNSSIASTQLSTTRACYVQYSYPTSMTTIIGSQLLTATLQYADDSGFTSNVVNLGSDAQGCSGILNLTLVGRLQVQGIVPAGKYRRVVLAQSGGANVPSTLTSGQEVLL